MLNQSIIAAMSMSSKSVRPIKIAFVKQEVYQDLYVHRAGETDAAALLTSSMARVGPIGLFTQLGAQAYIVKLDAARECQIFRKVCPKVASVVEGLREKPLNELPGQEFWQPGSSTPPGHYAESAWNIDWSQFDIVFCINIPLPKAVVRRYPRTLFAYMIGEYNALTSDVPRYGYDVSLVQRPSMTVQNKMGVLDFPYTFLGPTCLEDIMRQVLGRSGEKNGLYAEINMSKERPVVECPSVLREFARPDFPVRLHRQHIMQNLELIYDAKFFVKLGGRVIQGNSIAEAISTGTLVLANPDEVRHKELLPEFTCIQDANDLKAKINFFEQNDSAYHVLLDQQRALLKQYYFDNPITSLYNSLEHKRYLAGTPYGLRFYRLRQTIFGVLKRCCRNPFKKSRKG